MEITISEPKLTKQQAEALDAQILAAGENVAKHWRREVMPLALRIEKGDGHIALGFKTFNEYSRDLDERLKHRMSIKRLRDQAHVEENLGVEMPAQHAYVLAELPSAEAQREVFKEAMDEYQKPVENNFKALVERWFKKHKKSPKRAPASGAVKKDTDDGWSDADLEEDSELATALDRIEKAYGRSDRRAIQEGTIGLSRKDIIALSAFHVTKMQEVQYLIMGNHWDVATAFKFVNETVGRNDLVEVLLNHCIGTRGLRYVCNVDGFDIAVTACKALEKKIKG